jgi:hypothetical protein
MYLPQFFVTSRRRATSSLHEEAPTDSNDLFEIIFLDGFLTVDARDSVAGLFV